MRMRLASSHLPSHVLPQLNLYGNELGPEGAKALAAAIAASGSLAHLNLRSKEIGDAAQQLLWDAVRDRQGFRLDV